METNKFIDICKEEIVKYFNNECDKTDNFELTQMMYSLYGIVKHFKITKLYYLLLLVMECIMR